jgi:hypothetical protein
MKYLLTLFAITYSFNLVAQNIPKSAAKWLPLFYLDSVNSGSQQLLFDANKVAEVNIVSDYYDSANEIHGKVFMRSKAGSSFNFLSIPDILKMYKIDRKATILYSIDGNLLKDISNIKLDSSYISKVQVTRSANIAYLKSTFPNLLILEIYTLGNKSSGNQNGSRIRGTEPEPVETTFVE